MPSHLLTPFNGPVPPNNLLDKIARGISDAKGSDWPHAIRATRLKLAEIARAHASNVIPEEPQPDLFSDATNLARRPLYRQSSMDFMKLDDPKSMQSERIDRVSTRLQGTERIISTSPYNTRAASRRNSRRSSSPPRPTSLTTGPSTASSSTLASLASGPQESLRPRLLRRSLSVYSSNSSVTCASSGLSSNLSDRMSISSIDSCIAAAITSTESLVKTESKPTDRRMKRAESFTTSARHTGLKRAPSYGAIAQEAKVQGRAVSPCSSDEEEKARSRTAVKKARTKMSADISGGKAMLADGMTSPRKLASKKKAAAGDSITKRPTMNPQRNPSMFGVALPTMLSMGEEQRRQPSLAPPPGPPSPVLLSSPPMAAPTPRTLRRVKRLPASSISNAPALGRKISFGVLSMDGVEPKPSQRPSIVRLGSAFKLSP